MKTTTTPTLKLLFASAIGLTLLLVASPDVRANQISFSFLGATPDSMVDGVSVAISTTVAGGNVNYSSTQGYGVSGPPPGGALDPGESLDFGFSENVMLKEVSFWLANTNEFFTVALTSGGSSTQFTFPVGTDPNAVETVDVSVAALTGNSFRVTNTMQSGNYRVAGMTIETVPDGGSAVILLGMALSGLAFLGRRCGLS